jgi:4-oxalocrotonate tautomerase
MPFVNVKIVKGKYEATRDKIAKGMAQAIAANTDIPVDQVWVVFEDIQAEDWYVGEKSVAQMRAKRA